MPSSQYQAHRWLKQAANDLEVARLGLSEEFFSQACFWAQQSAEKAIKAIAHLAGDRTVLENSVAFLVDRYADRVPGMSPLKSESRLLDGYYRNARYPSGSSRSVPFMAFSREQANSAVGAAERFVELAREQIEAF